MTKDSLSVLCAAVAGGERLYEKLAASEAAHAVSRFEKRMAQTVEGFRGRLARGSGSRVIGYFSDPEDALQSAIEMQRRVASLPPMSGIALGVRVGVCVGHAANEISYFEDASPDNAAVSLSQLAEPGQVLMSVPKRASTFQMDDHVARSHPEIQLKSGKRQLGVFELDWRDLTVSQIRAYPANDADLLLPLFLHLNGQTIELGHDRPSLSFGRLKTCGIVLQGERCSRVHARIVLRGDTYVLVDESTNGTFVTPQGGNEHRLLKHELVLSGRGRISFGQPLGSGAGECAQYAIGERFELSRF